METHIDMQKTSVEYSELDSMARGRLDALDQQINSCLSELERLGSQRELILAKTSVGKVVKDSDRLKDVGRFDLREVVAPAQWKILTNDGCVVFKFENTLAAMLLGKERARRVAQPFLGTMPKFLFFMMFAPALFALQLLGFAKMVPEWIFLVGVVLSIGWIVYAYALCVDTKIYYYVCLSYANVAALVSAFLTGVFFAFMCGWDYRGCSSIFLFTSQAGVQIGMDAFCSRVRKGAAIPAQASAISYLSALLAMTYTEIFPDIDYSRTIFTVNLPDIALKQNITFSALSLFTQFNVVLLILFIKPWLLSIMYPGRLLNATVRLRAVDEPDIGPVESFYFLEKYLQFVGLGSTDLRGQHREVEINQIERIGDGDINGKVVPDASFV